MCRLNTQYVLLMEILPLNKNKSFKYQISELDGISLNGEWQLTNLRFKKEKAKKVAKYGGFTRRGQPP